MLPVLPVQRVSEYGGVRSVLDFATRQSGIRPDFFARSGFTLPPLPGYSFPFHSAFGPRQFFRGPSKLHLTDYATIASGGFSISGLTGIDWALDDNIALADASDSNNNKQGTVERLGGFVNPGLCEFRLTTESGVPVSTADRTSQGTLYLTPCRDAADVSPSGTGRVALYDGTRWKLYTNAEVSLSLSLSAGNIVDIFLYDNAGTLTLETAQWNSVTDRNTGTAFDLALQDGVLVKSGTTTRRYMGTVYGSGANVTEDSAAKRFVWSYYHRARKTLIRTTTDDSWNYTSTTVRQANATSANRVEVVIGLMTDVVRVSIDVDVFASGVASNFMAGVGIDSTTVTSAQLFGGAAPANGFGSAKARYVGFPGIGYHALNWLECSDASGGTNVWYGDNTGGLAKSSGMEGDIWC
jgi:hypothetical protein